MSNNDLSVDHFLVVGREGTFTSELARMIEPFGAVTLARDVAGGILAARARVEWTAHFIDLHGHGGNDADAIAFLGAGGSRIPTLVLAQAPSPALHARMIELDADVMGEPIDRALLERFIRRARAVRAARRRTPAAIMIEWQGRYELTAAEAFVLRCAVTGMKRRSIATRMRVLDGTVKKHAHNVIQKTGDASLDASVARVLREALSPA